MPFPVAWAQPHWPTVLIVGQTFWPDQTWHLARNIICLLPAQIKCKMIRNIVNPQSWNTSICAATHVLQQLSQGWKFIKNIERIKMNAVDSFLALIYIRTYSSVLCKLQRRRIPLSTFCSMMTLSCTHEYNSTLIKWSENQSVRQSESQDTNIHK